MYGERWVALRHQQVAGQDLAPGDLFPEDFEFRNPQAWIDAGYITRHIPSGKPGRPARSVDVSRPPLAEVGPDNSATAQKAGLEPADTQLVETRPKIDWEDLTGGPKPDGNPPFTGTGDAGI